MHPLFATDVIEVPSPDGAQSHVVGHLNNNTTTTPVLQESKFLFDYLIYFLFVDFLFAIINSRQDCSSNNTTEQ
jgi:hypothetical protein